VRLVLHATPAEVMRAVEALQQLGREQDVPERDLFAIALAVEECASNVVNHALRSDARQTFEVTIEHTAAAITVELRDRGPEFDPTGVATPESGPDDLGGHGILLVRHYADEVTYRREGDANVLRLTRKLGPPAPRGGAGSDV
jgi:serine/threonine-protein kinase RsbW